MTVYGWDLSNHDWVRHPVNLTDARKAGISFVTHKATEGDWYEDPYLAAFAAQLKRVAFPVEGTYHVLNHGINVAKQTDAWIDYVTSTLDWRKRACWIWQIDAEPLDGYAAPTKAEIAASAERLTSKLRIPAARVIVYGPRWVYEDRLTGLPYKLWASNYADRDHTFKALYPGDSASHWGAYSGQIPAVLQYTSGATIGAQPTCDANAVRVTDEAALQALFGHTTPAPMKEFTLDADAKARFDKLEAEVADLKKYVRSIFLFDTDHDGKVETQLGAYTLNRKALASTESAIAKLQASVDALAAKVAQ
jgi:hypothetical protein